MPRYMCVCTCSKLAEAPDPMCVSECVCSGSDVMMSSELTSRSRATVKGDVVRYISVLSSGHATQKHGPGRGVNNACNKM